MVAFNEIKEVIPFLQKTDNIDMVNKVIEVQSNIISMQEELMSLHTENSKLKDDKETEKKLKRFPKDIVLILSGTDDAMYCSKCWDDERKLIQVTRDDDYYKCPKYNNHNIFYKKSKYYHMMNQDNDSNIVR